MKQVYNFALIFEADVDRQLRDLSKAIQIASESDCALGRPHLTLAQFEADPSNAAQIWDHLKAHGCAPVSVNFSGLTFLPSSDGGQWIEVSIIRTDALTMAQEAATRALTNVRILNRTGDLFRPHITLARTSEARTVSVRLDHELLRQKNVLSYPALDIAGGEFDVFAMTNP